MTRVSDICSWLSWLGQMLPVSPGTGIAAAATDSRSGPGVFLYFEKYKAFSEESFLV